MRRSVRDGPARRVIVYGVMGFCLAAMLYIYGVRSLTGHGGSSIRPISSSSDSAAPALASAAVLEAGREGGGVGGSPEEGEEVGVEVTDVSEDGADGGGGNTVASDEDGAGDPEEEGGGRGGEHEEDAGAAAEAAVGGRGDDPEPAPLLDEIAADAGETATESWVPQSPPPPAARRLVAISITVTKDGPYLDGAAVLFHSIRKVYPPGAAAARGFDVEVVAIVHPQVTETRAALSGIGYKLLEYDQPVYSKEIRGRHLRDTIDGSGCCGAGELLKLRAYQLTQYDRVLLLDMDTLLVKDVDSLFNTKGPSLIYTADYPMVSPTSRVAPPVQGGFLLVKPDEAVYEELVELVREGDFQMGSGWKSTGIGWWWGGQTVQGLLAYYYNRTRPGWGMEVDPCIYNSQSNSDKVPFDVVRTVHYTACQKPWTCMRLGGSLCDRMTDEWWAVRRDLEQASGLPRTPRCQPGQRYPPLNHAAAATAGGGGVR